MDETNEIYVGNTVTGKDVKVDEEQVFVDIGYKTKGIRCKNELSNLHVDDPSEVIQEGEEVTLLIKSVDDEEVILSKKILDAERAWEDLQKKYESQEVFETKVKEIVKRSE